MVNRHAGWMETASQINAIATATRAAVTGQYHIIHSIQAYFSSGSVDRLVQLKDGAVVVWQGYTSNGFLKADFKDGFSLSQSTAMNCTLASGGPSTVGIINVHGNTH